MGMRHIDSKPYYFRQSATIKIPHLRGEGRSEDCELLDLPTNIILKIISNLNPKERGALGKSCKRLNHLVFEDKQLLTDLDFSDNGFTSASDIQEYFSNKNTYKHVQRIRVNNFDPEEPNHMLFNYISKATNLVEIDVQGTKFKNFRELGTLLRPLQSLLSLSIDWPSIASENTELGLETLRKPFSKLKYLTVYLEDNEYSKTFIRAILLCQELVGLVMFGDTDSIVDQRNASSPWSIEPKKLRKLEWVFFAGPCAAEIKKHVTTMLPNPEEWKDLDSNSPDSFDLIDKKSIAEEVQNPFDEVIEKIPHLHPWVYFKAIWLLPLECLTGKALAFTDKRELEELCCFSEYEDREMCILKLADAKLLLENDKHQISYLTLNHDIEPECDVHSVALAFPRLNELVLSNIIQSTASPLNKTMGKRPIKKKHAGHDEQDRLRRGHACFRQLVENTPHIKSLTIHARRLGKGRFWELDALHLIPGWSRLRTLCLSSIPISSGQFLIEIGKQCKYLENLKLSDLGMSRVRYMVSLSKMLRHCHNLRDFSIYESNLGQVSDVFESLINSPDLKSVHLTSGGNKNSTTDLISSVERLFHRSCKLMSFICLVDGVVHTTSEKLMSTLQRLKEDLNRPNLRFQVYHSSSDLKHALKTLNLDNTRGDSPSSSSNCN